MTDPALTHLRSQLHERAKPLARAMPRSLREHSEERARSAFVAATELSGLSEREIAARLGVCQRMIRDWRSGARALPSWAPLCLPAQAQVIFLRELADAVPDDDSEESRHVA